MEGTTVIYQCPCCDAGLLFSPEKQKFKCEFCLSVFTKEELDATDSARRAEEKLNENKAYSEKMQEYRCQSCGAEVIADDHTAATFCLYCHNPIVLVGRVKDELRPDKIIPFRFSKEEAANRFLAYVKKHKFVPKDYYSKEQIEKISGVYYPFWVTDADVFASYHTRAHKRRSWRMGDYVYTETTTYAIAREGNIHFEDIVHSALSEADKQMLEGVLPFPSDSHIDFDMAYLSGCLAKKRNLAREALSSEVREKLDQHSKTLLRSTISGYSSIDPADAGVNLKKSHWSYTLLPVWMLNYHAKNGKSFAFAMNGHTGKIYGELPVSPWKLLALSLGVFAGVFLLLFLLFGVL